MSKLTAVELADQETWTEITDCVVRIDAEYDGYSIDPESGQVIPIQTLLDFWLLHNK